MLSKKNKSEWTCRDLNPRPPPCQRIPRIDKDKLNEYLHIKALSGVTNSHLYETNRFLLHYLKYVNYRIEHFVVIKNIIKFYVNCKDFYVNSS